MAELCCASSKRLAMVARRRVIGTRFSTRSPVSTGAAGFAGADGTAAVVFAAVDALSAF